MTTRSPSQLPSARRPGCRAQRIGRRTARASTRSARGTRRSPVPSPRFGSDPRRRPQGRRCSAFRRLLSVRVRERAGGATRSGHQGLASPPCLRPTSSCAPPAIRRPGDRRDQGRDLATGVRGDPSGLRPRRARCRRGIGGMGRVRPRHAAGRPTDRRLPGRCGGRLRPQRAMSRRRPAGRRRGGRAVRAPGHAGTGRRIGDARLAGRRSGGARLRSDRALALRR